MDKTCVLSRINALPGPVRWGRHVASQSASRLPHSGKSAKSVFRGCGIQHERRSPAFVVAWCYASIISMKGTEPGNRNNCRMAWYVRMGQVHPEWRRGRQGTILT